MKEELNEAHLGFEQRFKKLEKKMVIMKNIKVQELKTQLSQADQE